MGGRSGSFKKQHSGGLLGIKQELSKTNFEKLYGKELVDKVALAINKLPNDVKKMYEKHLSEIQFRKNGYDGKTSTFLNTVGISKSKLEHDDVGMDLDTFFHETAHALDSSGKWLDSNDRPSEKAGLREALISDYRKTVYGNLPDLKSIGQRPRKNTKDYEKKIAEYSKKQRDLISKRSNAEDKFLNKISQWKKLPSKNRLGFSDILENSSSISRTGYVESPLGGGHGGHSYWNGKNSKGSSESEFFADVNAAVATHNTTELKLIKKYYPNSFKKYKETVSRITQRKSLYDRVKKVTFRGEKK